MCIRDRLKEHQAFAGMGYYNESAYEIDYYIKEWEQYIPVSYTHLDVYKRQGLYQQLRRLPHSFPHIKDSPAKTPTFQTTRSPVSYTHLDVYKRQPLLNG